MSTDPRKRMYANPLLDADASDDGTMTLAKGKSRRVSTDTTAAGTGAPEGPNNNPESTPRSMEMLVQTDLFHPDIRVVETALCYLNRAGFTQDDEKCDKVVSVGGCLALVALLEKHLQTFSKCEPISCHSALEDERRLLCKIVSLIKAVAYKNKKSVNVFAGVRGIEATIALMEAIPLCGEIQGAGCGALCNLTSKESDFGVTKVMAARGMETLITAIRQHTKNRDICRCACKALFNLILNSKENTRLLLRLGGVAAVVKVTEKWPESSEPADAAKVLMLGFYNGFHNPAHM